jgi:PAS domain S-box-containing protein
MAVTRLSNADSALLLEQAEVLEMIVRGRPLAAVLEALCTVVERHSEWPVRAVILLADAGGKHLRTGGAPSLPDAYNRATDGIAVGFDAGTCAAAAARGEVVITRDIATDPSWASLRHLPLGLGLAAAWSMPILSATQTVLGTFGTYFTEPREPRSPERRLVEVLAHTAALAIERDRVDRTLHEHALRQRFLAELQAATQSRSEPSEVLATTARMLAEHLGVDRCVYAEVEDERVFDVTGDHTSGVPSIVGRWEVAVFGAECVRQMRAGEPYVVEDAELDPRITEHHLAAYRAMSIRAGVCVPLHKGGKLTMAMAVLQAAPRRWSTEEIELVAVVVARCWEALERARVTRNLRDSEARYRAIVEATPECVKLVAADGTLLHMNAAGLRMIEVPSEAHAVGRSVYDMVAPEHRDAFRGFNEAVCRGEGGALAFDIVGAEGSRRSMETTAVPLPSPTGDFVHLAVTRDVSARAAADRALAQSRARLDYAVRLSGVGFWYCDLPFSELNWDVRVKQHFFLSPDARVTIELFCERIHLDDRQRTREAIDASIRDRVPFDLVFRTVDPSTGAIKWIRALGGTAGARDGTPTQFDGVTVDVTAQKLDEERLAGVANAALTIHSSSSLANVLRVVTEEACGLIGAHRAITSLTNDASAQVIRTVALADPHRSRAHDLDLDPGAGDVVMSRIVRPVRMTQAELEANPAWHGRAGRGDSDVPLRGLLAVPFVGRDGARLGFVQLSDKIDGEFTAADEAILIQLAQLAVVAIENARLYDQLRDQDRRKDEFLATLAHELRNPLAPLRTGLNVLRFDVSAEQAARTHAMMERQLGHLVHMVDDLLDISRVTLGKITLKKERVDLRNVLDSALETTRSLVDAGGHHLAVRLPKQPLPLDVDPTRLSQVFANLINNAAKYTPDGGHIQISASADGTTLRVRVSDTGVGIPADMLPYVFDMFTQVGRSIERSQGGLGIGLTLVRRLVEMHGGSVVAESQAAGQGSSFVVTLPLASTDAATPAPTETLAAPVASLRILVVDDNVDAAETLAMLLELAGNQTRVAHSGLVALDAASEFRPQVVFLDIGLPGLNGYEVARRLRVDAGLPRPLLVALTGWGTDEDRRQAHDAGFDRHLVKPADSSKIAAVLADARR